MKKILLLLLFVNYCILSNAQGVSSLSQNFDGVCPTATDFPTSWFSYNPLPGTSPGAWLCDPTHGRKNAAGVPTPGMSCTGVWGGNYNLDTAYLVTPLFNFVGHSHAYLYFDAKADSILLGGKLRILVYPNDTPFFDTNAHTDVTSSAMTPLITPNDSANWVTHMVDLSSYTSNIFYVAFMYTSNTTTGSSWHLDNINTSLFRLETPALSKGVLPLTVLGNANSSRILLSYGSAAPGSYQLCIYDMMGRQVHSEIVNVQGHGENYLINGLSLVPGMYFIKMMGGNSYGITKTIVE